MLKQFTAITLMIAAALLTGCESSPSRTGVTEPVSLLNEHRGNDAGLAGPEIYLITSQDQLDASGSEALGAKGYNFDEISIVVISGGEQATGGYWVNIDGIQSDGKTLYVQGTFNAPGSGSITTQQLTHPYHAVVIEKVGNVVLSSNVRSVTGQQLPE